MEEVGREENSGSLLAVSGTHGNVVIVEGIPRVLRKWWWLREGCRWHRAVGGGQEKIQT